jgi:hypothetical protein
MGTGAAAPPVPPPPVPAPDDPGRAVDQQASVGPPATARTSKAKRRRMEEYCHQPNPMGVGWWRYGSLGPARFASSSAQRA